jgi:enamine deaminase RidA (YjgF/YER057c/UK114 family)
LTTHAGHVGELDRVVRIVKIVGFVNCAADFTQQPEVIDGCSRMLANIFGSERGAHARSAVGTNSLPRNVPVEIEMVAEVAPEATL